MWTAENFRPEVFNQNSYCIMVFFQKYSSRDILPENIIMMDFTRIFGMVGDVFGQNLEFFLTLDLTRKKCDWQFLSRGIRPEKDFFGLRWILPETNKKMFFFQRPLIQKKNGCRILPENIFLYYSSRKKNILVGSIRTYSG